VIHPFGAANSSLAALAGFAVLLLGPYASAQENANARPMAFSAWIGGGPGIPVVRAELEGRTLRYDNGRGSRARIVPRLAQWQALRHALDEIDPRRWKSGPAHEVVVMEVSGWSVTVAYPDRALHLSGYLSHSDSKTVARLQYAIEQLLGGRPFGGRRIGRLQLYDLSELRLIATRARGAARERRAEFRVPDGRTYHARIGDYVGTDHGLIKAIQADAVLLLELKTDTSGKWVEAETWIRKASQ
jgi:hypothetical protein